MCTTSGPGSLIQVKVCESAIISPQLEVPRYAESDSKPPFCHGETLGISTTSRPYSISMRCGEENAVRSFCTNPPPPQKANRHDTCWPPRSSPPRFKLQLGVTGGGIAHDVANAELNNSSRLSGHFTSTENIITRHGRTAQLHGRGEPRPMVPVSEWTRSNGINQGHHDTHLIMDYSGSGVYNAALSPRNLPQRER